MNTIFQPLLRKCVLVFVDDILIYSPTLEAHVEHLQQVFNILNDHQLLLKRSKCSFAQQTLEYLGHSGQGVATDPKKIEAVANWPPPSDTRVSRSIRLLSKIHKKLWYSESTSY